jgi:hypothetical protein
LTGKNSCFSARWEGPEAFEGFFGPGGDLEKLFPAVFKPY